jgi:hypothetical protein
MAALALFHPVFVEPLFGPLPGLFGGSKLSFELDDIQFFGQLAKTRPGDGSQADKLVTVEQRHGT